MGAAVSFPPALNLKPCCEARVGELVGSYEEGDAITCTCGGTLAVIDGVWEWQG